MALAITAKAARAIATPSHQPGDNTADPWRLVIAAREQDREDDENGDRADVDEHLGEPDELSVELEIERGEAREGNCQTKRAMDKVAQRHRRERADDN